MNKSTTNLSRVEVRDSDKGEILESFILNSDGTPYDLSGKSLVFNENKDGDKFVSDPNVTIVDARIGHITYQLHDQVHSAPGTAWFDIIQDGAKIDSTTDFYIEVRDGLKCTVYNTTYISDLEKLKQQMEALIQQADGELKAELQKAEQQLSQELQNFRNQYNSLSADFQNQFKTAQDARQQDYNNQKNAINADWTNNKGEIWGQWNSDKASIDKQAQDTVQAIKDNAKQVLDEDQANWNAKQTQWDSTFSAIVKEWQVKTNSLNSTVQDLTNKFNTIIGQVSDLMDNKLPAMDSKTDAVQAKVDELRASLGQIDWTTFARRTDNSGGVNLLANTDTLKGFFNDVDSTHYAIDDKSDHSKETNISLVKTKIIHIWGDKAKTAPLSFSQGLYLPAGTYTLSFLARTNGIGSSLNFGFFSDWTTQNNNGRPLGESDSVNNIWGKHQLTFTITQPSYHTGISLVQYDDTPLPGGSLYFANLKLESGSIATDWCQSYLDFDRLSGGFASLDSPEFNNINNTGIYLITNPQKGNDYPGNGNGGILKVSSAHDDRIEQEYYEDVANGSIYHRQAVSGTWRAWQKLANIDDLSKVKIKLQSLDQNGDTFTNTQTANKQSDGSYVINIYDNDWTANRVNWLLNNTASYSIESNTDLNDVKAPGLYHCSGASNIVNVPGGEDNWFNMVVNSDNWNGSQTLYATHTGQFYVRTWNATTLTPWRRVVNEGDLNNVLANRSITSITDYDVGAEEWHNTQTSKFNSSGNFANYLVDARALKPIAHAINSLKGQGAYRVDSAVDVNTLTGLENQVTVYILTNSENRGIPISLTEPSMSDARGTLIVFNYDGNAKTQIWMPIGTSKKMGFAWRYWEGNNVPAWNIPSDTINSLSNDNNSLRQNISDLSDRLSGFMMSQSAFQRRVDYSTPAGNISDTTVNLNDYRETGILKLTNCYIQNGPYKTDNPHWIFVKITAFDGNTAYQTIDEGDNLYKRKFSSDGWSKWFKYENQAI